MYCRRRLGVRRGHRCDEGGERKEPMTGENANGKTGNNREEFGRCLPDESLPIPPLKIAVEYPKTLKSGART